VVIPTKYKDLHASAHCIDLVIPVATHPNKMHTVPIGAIFGLAYLVQGNAASGSINSVWLGNDHVDLDTNWTGYELD
jgi:hypothetical protein